MEWSEIKCSNSSRNAKENCSHSTTQLTKRSKQKMQRSYLRKIILIIRFIVYWHWQTPSLPPCKKVWNGFYCLWPTLDRRRAGQNETEITEPSAVRRPQQCISSPGCPLVSGVNTHQECPPSLPVLNSNKLLIGFKWLTLLTHTWRQWL